MLLGVDSKSGLGRFAFHRNSLLQFGSKIEGGLGSTPFFGLLQYLDDGTPNGPLSWGRTMFERRGGDMKDEELRDEVARARVMAIRLLLARRFESDLNADTVANGCLGNGAFI